jgi:hypothetical protein
MVTDAGPMGLALGIERTVRLGSVFGNAFNLFGRSFGAFIAIAAFVLSPFYLVLLAAVVLRPAGTLAHLVVVPPVALMLVICPTIANGAMTYAVARSLRGQPARTLDTLKVLVRHLPPLLGVGMCLLPLLPVGALLAVSAGFAVAVFFPSIMAEPRYLITLFILFLVIGHCIWFAAAPVCVAERVRVRVSLFRGRFLTKGHRRPIFGAFFLIVIADVFISIMARMAVTQISAGAGLIGLDVARLLASYIVQVVFLAFVAVVAAVFYHQLRVAKGGSDISSLFD